MTADGKLPPAERRNYKNVFDALMRIVKEESVLTLWKGATPTVARAMVVNGAQLASYSQSKEALVKTGHFQEGIFLHFCASMISGLVTTIASMPVDIVKTRIQKSSGSTSAVVNIKLNLLPIIFYLFFMKIVFKKTFVDVIKNEGVFSLWKGFTPYYARLGPQIETLFAEFERFTQPKLC